MLIPDTAHRVSSRYAPLNRPLAIEPDWGGMDGFERPRPRFSGGDERYTLALAQRLQAEVATREAATLALDGTAQDFNPLPGEVKTGRAQLTAEGFSCSEGEFAFARQGRTYTGVSPSQGAIAIFTEQGVSLEQYRW